MLSLASVALGVTLGSGPWLVSVPIPKEPGRWSTVVSAPGDFDEAVLSYAQPASARSGIKLFVRPAVDGAGLLQIADYKLEGARTSIKSQKDAFASVDTDTLSLVAPSRNLEVVVQPDDPAAVPSTVLKSLRVSLINSKVPYESREPNRQAWGQTLEPPRRAQSTYVGGGVLCSPTSVSMDLGYWAKELNRAEIDHDVPEVQRGVFDADYNGTGNWSFNMAFAGSQPGMTAYVSRFRDVRDLEDWVASGVPVACSVAYGLLKGKPKRDPDDGHLVLLVGFTKSGDLIFNDPGRNVVRMTYKRADFERAWAVSRHTVYLIYPEGWRVPKGDGPWDHS